MEKKNKKELIEVIENQNKTLQKYKSRLHDLIESYKHLVKEKETLESSIKVLTEVNSSSPNNEEETEVPSVENKTEAACSKSNDSVEKLKGNFGFLAAEKTRIENELRADRKKILQEKEDVERTLIQQENSWFLERDKLDNQIAELRKRVGMQQREREKEQQDHGLMMKELQIVVANERGAKEKLEQQLSEVQLKLTARVVERKNFEQEKNIEDLKNRLIVSENQLQASKNDSKKMSISMQRLREELEDTKAQFLLKIDEEKERADLTEEKLKLLTVVKEKRISSLESRISELSELAGDHDKERQETFKTIQQLKARVSQLQLECSTIAKDTRTDSKFAYSHHDDLAEKEASKEHSHHNCQEEIFMLKEEIERYKSREESIVQEKHTNYDAKSSKEIKELRSRLTQLQDQLLSCKSQLKLSEEYHNKITSNLEKTAEDLRLQHKQGMAQLEMANRVQLMELEQQIQKQRERTLLLLEEKDKELALIKSSFISPLAKKNDAPSIDATTVDSCGTIPPDREPMSFVPSSLVSSKADNHILHYVQELARKDVEIAGLRKSQIQTSSALRKLQQNSALAEEKYTQDTEMLRSRIKLLERSQDKEGTNVEYLKNVILRFLKCADRNSKTHMVNAIATVLHFTSEEVLDVKAHIK